MNDSSRTARDEDCNGFEPQNYLRDRCKKCFRLKTKHATPAATTSATTKATATDKKTKTTVRRPNTMPTIAATVPMSSSLGTIHSPSTPSTSSTSPTSVSSTSNSSPASGILPPALGHSRPAALNVTVSASRPNNNLVSNSNGLATNSKNLTVGDVPIMTTSMTTSSPNASTAPNVRPRSMASSASIDNIILANNNNNNNSSSSSSLKSSASFGKKERRRSWRDKANNNNNCDEGPDFEDAADSVSLASYKTANSKGISSTKSMESVNSTMDSRSMVTAMSGGSVDFNGNDEDRAITPTDAAEFLDRDIMTLRKENTRLQDQVQKLKVERQRWTRLRRKSKVGLGEVGGGPRDEEQSGLVEMLEERLAEAESLLQEYRDENSSLKSELRHVQENFAAPEKLRAAESRCEELALKNGELQRNVDELQQEIEEMQDQYREEEIDEFRELQRELEQNAKNCRILQFKLRKSERQREQLQSEKNHFALKLRELQPNANANLTADAKLSTSLKAPNENGELKDLRVRELESELRIAKEVSVRLHNELEAAEDKRYKLEDEIFYYKEKLRELQTQNKWRETRNKVDKTAKRQSQELSETILNEDEMSKELRDVLERETDLREQLKFTEEDLHRTQTRLKESESENEELMGKLVSLTEGKNILAQINAANNAAINAAKQQRSPMTRSFSEDANRSNGSINSLRSHSNQCNTNNSNNNDGKPYKTFAVKKSELSLGEKQSSTTGGFEISAEVEKDIAKLLATIHELERKNGELQIVIQKNEAKIANLHSQQQQADSRGLSVELRKEQEQRKELLAELIEYKQLIAKSDNSKLIAMATKVELLTNQLKALNDRCQTLHKKSAKDGDEKYADNLKIRCDLLEKQLSELKARKTFQANSGDNRHGTASKIPSADEIEQCCVLLASVDAHADRIAKQLEKMDTAQKEERRRSLSKDNFAVVVADLANVMAELKVLHKVLDSHKMLRSRGGKETTNESKNNNKDNNSNNNNNNNTDTESESLLLTRKEKEKEKSCKSCAEKTLTIDAQKEEISFYKKKNKELTNQILQTEDRWTAEIEKQSRDHQDKIEKLRNDLKQMRANLREQTQIADAQAAAFGEKDKLIEEMGAKLQKTNLEMNEKLKQIHELEKEQKVLKEWEIRHKKLESLYEKEKQKFDTEKARIKADTNVLKKRTDEALSELTRLRDGHQRREILWTEERSRLEHEISQLKGRLAQSRDAANANANSIAMPMNIDENSNPVSSRIVPIRTVNYRTAAVAAAAAKSNSNKDDEQLDRLRQKCLELEKKNEEIEHQLQTTRTAKAELEMELNKNKQVWEREKDTVTHRKRQDEKIRGVELDALQQKFTSRMNIMETSNKSLHSQLTQTRRERDLLRESVASHEQKLKEQLKAIESERAKYSASFAKFADTEKKLSEALASMQRLTDELSLAKETHKADKKLWAIEKSRLGVADSDTQPQEGLTEDEARNRAVTEKALKAAEDVQKQYSEYQKFYSKEVNRLKAKIKALGTEMTAKEIEFQRRAKELMEQIKVLEIDQKNLVQVKEMQANAREAMQAEHQKLTQILQQSEVHKITRRYKIASIVEQLNSLLEKGGYRNVRSLQDDSAILLINIINQLNMLKEDDGLIQGQCPTAIGETLSETDTTIPSDSVSQTSTSLQSTPMAGHVNPLAANNRRVGGIGQFSSMTASNRSASIESNTTWDSRLLDYTARSVSPTKRILYPEQPATNLAIHNNNNSKERLLHNYGRSLSHNKYGGSGNVDATSASVARLNFNLRQMRSANTLTEEFADDLTISHSRMNSTGTNVLYKIRRQELAKGTNPSVRSMAQAFESMRIPSTEKNSRQKSSPAAQLRSFFSIRKSRSVDTEAKKQKEFETSMTTATEKRATLNRHAATSMSQIESNDSDLYSSCASSTLPRGGRNPFKNMGAKIVERVRRSLSRSSRRDESQEKTPVPQQKEDREQQQQQQQLQQSEMKRGTMTTNKSELAKEQTTVAAQPQIQLQSQQFQQLKMLQNARTTVPRTMTHVVRMRPKAKKATNIDAE